jgi:uncharacterized protein
MRKRLGIVAMLLVGAFALAATVFQPKTTLAETPAPIQRTLDVSGTGTLTVKYDTAEITLGVSELKPASGEAFAAMSTSMDKVVNALKAKGVKDLDLKTGTLQLNAEYDWTKEGQQQLRGFRATNTLHIRTKQLDKVADLVQVAVEAGANQLQGVRFLVEDTDKLLNDALDLAVDDAKAKAERVASRLGTKVVGVYRISVNDGGRGPVMYDAYRAEAGYAKPMAAAPAAPVFSGTSEYTATVSVTFELQ